MTRLPRHFVHRGHVPASAFLLDDTPGARATLVRGFRPGHELRRLGSRLLWRLLEPRRTACDAAPGLPLVEVEGRLTGAPFAPSQVHKAVRGEVLFVDRGQVTAAAPGERIDVSTYIDVGELELAAVASLGDPPAPPAPALVPLPGDPVRAAIGLQPLSAEARDVMEALRSGHPSAGARPTVGPLGRALVSALRWLTSLLPGGRPAPAAASGAQAAAVPAPPRRWRWLERLDRWLDRVLDVSRLSSFLGRRQAEYLNRLMEMFEDGDLDRALRHAVPLGGPGGLPARRSLSLPTPRSSLDFSRGGARAGDGAIVLQNDAYEQLRRRYRAAAQRLEQQGRYAEAAFVLAELLQANEEAVAMLEKHAQYRLAAELAESRNLAAGLQVRLWFLAKDLPRAIAVARRHGAFADAVQRLERSGHGEYATQLRLVWANGLAEAGDYQNAVMTVWPLPTARTLAQRWMELGIALGGAAGARLRIKRLALNGPEPEDEAALLEALESEDAERAVERLAVAGALNDEGSKLGAATAGRLARAAVRSSLRDGLVADPVRADLLTVANDGALRADLPPPASRAPRLHTVAPEMVLRFAASDRGALPVSEAAWLPGGKLLLALGEAGARLLNRDGRTSAHFDVPAHRLVTYDSGSHALLLAPRAGAWSIHRVDLAGRKVEPLGQLPLVDFAADTDGALWLVSQPGAVAALDLQSPRLAELWRVQAAALSLARNALSFSMLTLNDHDLEWWRYELPSLTLRVRQQLPPSPAQEHVVTPNGHVLGVDDRARAWVQQGAGQPVTRPIAGAQGTYTRDFACAGDWVSLVSEHDPDLWWRLADYSNATVRWAAQFEGLSATGRARLRGDVATWADSEGRVLVVDLATGQLLRDLRVR